MNREEENLFVVLERLVAEASKSQRSRWEAEIQACTQPLVTADTDSLEGNGLRTLETYSVQAV